MMMKQDCLGENGRDLEMLHVRGGVGTWERTIVESIFRSCVRVRLPGIICQVWFFLCKVITLENPEVL